MSDQSNGEITPIPYNFEVRNPSETISNSGANLPSVLGRLRKATGYLCQGVIVERCTLEHVDGHQRLLLHLGFAQRGGDFHTVQHGTFDEKLAGSFCRAVTTLNDPAQTIIKELSKGGSLGLAAIDGSNLWTTWNTVLIEKTNKGDPGGMMVIAGRLLSEKDPLWVPYCWNVVHWGLRSDVSAMLPEVLQWFETTQGGSCMEIQPKDFTTALKVADPMTAMQIVRGIDKATFMAGVAAAQEFLRILQRKSAVKKSADELWNAIIKDCPEIFREGEALEQELDAMIKRVDMSLEDQHRLLMKTANFANRLHEPFRGTAELHQMLKEWIEMTWLSATGFGVGASAAGAAAGGWIQWVAIEGLWKRSALGAFACVSATKSAYDVYQIVKNKPRNDLKKQLLHYLAQTWWTTEECLALLRLVRMEDGSVYFIHEDGAEQFVKKLRDRFDVVGEGMTKAEMVLEWLKQITKELTQTRTEIMKEVLKFTK